MHFLELEIAGTRYAMGIANVERVIPRASGDQIVVLRSVLDDEEDSDKPDSIAWRRRRCAIVVDRVHGVLILDPSEAVVVAPPPRPPFRGVFVLEDGEVLSTTETPLSNDDRALLEEAITRAFAHSPTD